MKAKGASERRNDLVRVDLLVLAIAVFVAGYALWSELDYARFEADGARVEARIERIDKIPSGRRFLYHLHYSYDWAGKTYIFHDRDDPDRLDELYTATFNAFTDPESPIAVGKTIGLLIDRSAPERHRPDRARLTLPWLLHVRTVFAVLFLGGVGTWLWRSRKASVAQANVPARRSSALTRRAGGLLELRVELDVPWTDGAKASDAQAALRERMAVLKAPQEPEAHPKVTTIRVAVVLSPSVDITLDGVYVELSSRSASRDVHTLARGPRLRAGQEQRYELERPAPDDLTEVRVSVVDTPSKTFTHAAPA